MEVKTKTNSQYHVGQFDIFENGGKGPVIWTQVRQELRSQIGADAFDKWLSSIVFVAEIEGKAVLAAASRVDQERVERDYLRRIAGVWASLDPKTRAVKIVAETDLSDDLRQMARENQEAQLEGALELEGEVCASAGQPVLVASDGVLEDDRPLTGGDEMSQSFETLVVGPSNRLAAKVARKISDGLAGPVSVALFYGAHGVGKTHILRSIEKATASRIGGKSVVYMSAEDFMLAFVDGVKKKDTSVQRNRIRNAKVVLLDDLQLITSRTATLKEFFQHLRAVTASGGKVVLSADAAPTRLDCLDDRMRDDIQGGVVVEVHRPDASMRADIIRSKVEIIRRDFPSFELQDSWVEMMAERLPSSGRALYGAVRNVFAGTVLADKQVTESAVDASIRLQVGERGAPKIDTIKSVVARYYDMTKADLESSSRQRPLAQARQIAMYFCRELTTCSFPLIGYNFGKRDHTTVIYGCRKVTNRLKKEPELKAELDKVKALILDDHRNLPVHAVA